MKLVSADHISDEDLYVQYFLECYPAVKYRITRLLNSYRELATMSFEAMQQGETDTADGWKALAKRDAEAQRLDIPLFEGMQDWAEVSKQLDAVSPVVQEEGAKIRTFLTFQQKMDTAISQIGTIADEEEDVS